MPFRPRILVVDDDPQMLSLLGEVLAKMGTEPQCVLSSRQAAELVNKEKFDGVFLDWLMPELDGLQLAERIRWSKTNSTCPMVMLTGNQEPDAMRQCFRVGINFFLQKPATVERIQGLVKAARDLMMQERLRYQRIPLVVPIRCRWQVQAFEQSAKGESVNLSTSGMLARVDSEPPAGALVQLSFLLPGEREPFACTACVVRHAGGGLVGLRFVNLSRDERWRLMNFSKATLTDAVAHVL
ncbi:MAG: response regulator [Candidatus Acidiferrales bacterium]